MNDRIVIDPEIQHGKPVIRGTRVPVTRLLAGLAGGMSFEELCREYEVKVEDIREAIGYAEELVDRESHFRWCLVSPCGSDRCGPSAQHQTGAGTIRPRASRRA